MSSISSASSRMTTWTASKRRLPRLRWSTARPGVATTTSTPRAQAAQLLADRLAAVDRQDPGAELAAVLAEGLGDLHRELAGRDEDERGRGAWRRPARWGCAGGSAARTRRSCRCRSAPRRGGRGRRGAAGSPRAGSASAPRSRARQGREEAVVQAQDAEGIEVGSSTGGSEAARARDRPAACRVGVETDPGLRRRARLRLRGACVGLAAGPPSSGFGLAFDFGAGFVIGGLSSIAARRDDCPRGDRVEVDRPDAAGPAGRRFGRWPPG